MCLGMCACNSMPLLKRPGYRKISMDFCSLNKRGKANVPTHTYTEKKTNKRNKKNTK